MIKINIPSIDEIKPTMQELKIKRVGPSTDVMGFEGKKVYCLFRDFDYLPKSEGVYFIFDINKELIYVGASLNNIFRRFQEHSSSTVWFTKEATYVAYVLTKNFNITPYAAEMIYISLYEPFYNNKSNSDNFVLKGGVCLFEIHDEEEKPQIVNLIR